MFSHRLNHLQFHSKGIYEHVPSFTEWVTHDYSQGTVLSTHESKHYNLLMSHGDAP
jgi:hypothetical protein